MSVRWAAAHLGNRREQAAAAGGEGKRPQKHLYPVRLHSHMKCSLDPHVTVCVQHSVKTDRITYYKTVQAVLWSVLISLQTCQCQAA